MTVFDEHEVIPDILNQNGWLLSTLPPPLSITIRPDQTLLSQFLSANMSADEADKVYARVMSNHPFGIGLYKPLKRTVLYPGACGYFDSFGGWNPIVNLDIALEVKKKGLAPMEIELERAPIEDDIRWGPKVSNKTRAIAMEISAGV